MDSADQHKHNGPSATHGALAINSNGVNLNATQPSESRATTNTNTTTTANSSSLAVPVLPQWRKRAISLDSQDSSNNPSAHPSPSLTPALALSKTNFESADSLGVSSFTANIPIDALTNQGTDHNSSLSSSRAHANAAVPSDKRTGQPQIQRDVIFPPSQYVPRRGRLRSMQNPTSAERSIMNSAMSDAHLSDLGASLQSMNSKSDSSKLGSSNIVATSNAALNNGGNMALSSSSSSSSGVSVSSSSVNITSPVYGNSSAYKNMSSLNDISGSIQSDVERDNSSTPSVIKSNSSTFNSINNNGNATTNSLNTNNSSNSIGNSGIGPKSVSMFGIQERVSSGSNPATSNRELYYPSSMSHSQLAFTTVGGGTIAAAGRSSLGDSSPLNSGQGSTSSSSSQPKSNPRASSEGSLNYKEAMQLINKAKNKTWSFPNVAKYLTDMELKMLEKSHTSFLEKPTNKIDILRQVEPILKKTTLAYQTSRSLLQGRRILLKWWEALMDSVKTSAYSDRSLYFQCVIAIMLRYEFDDFAMQNNQSSSSATETPVPNSSEENEAAKKIPFALAVPKLKKKRHNSSPPLFFPNPTVPETNPTISSYQQQQQQPSSGPGSNPSFSSSPPNSSVAIATVPSLSSPSSVSASAIVAAAATLISPTTPKSSSNLSPPGSNGSHHSSASQSTPGSNSSSKQRSPPSSSSSTSSRNQGSAHSNSSQNDTSWLAAISSKSSTMKKKSRAWSVSGKQGPEIMKLDVIHQGLNEDITNSNENCNTVEGSDLPSTLITVSNHAATSILTTAAPVASSLSLSPCECANEDVITAFRSLTMKTLTYATERLGQKGLYPAAANFGAKVLAISFLRIPSLSRFLLKELSVSSELSSFVNEMWRSAEDLSFPLATTSASASDFNIGGILLKRWKNYDGELFVAFYREVLRILSQINIEETSSDSAGGILQASGFAELTAHFLKLCIHAIVCAADFMKLGYQSPWDAGVETSNDVCDEGKANGATTVSHSNGAGSNGKKAGSSHASSSSSSPSSNAASSSNVSSNKSEFVRKGWWELMILRLADPALWQNVSRDLCAKVVNATIQAVARRANVHDLPTVFYTFEFVEKLLMSTLSASDGNQFIEQIDYTFLCELFERALMSEHCFCLFRAISALYTLLPHLPESMRGKFICESILAPPTFHHLFGHWHLSVRSLFHRVLLYRIVRYRFAKDRVFDAIPTGFKSSPFNIDNTADVVLAQAVESRLKSIRLQYERQTQSAAENSKDECAFGRYQSEEAFPSDLNVYVGLSLNEYEVAVEDCKDWLRRCLKLSAKVSTPTPNLKASSHHLSLSRSTAGIFLNANVNHSSGNGTVDDLHMRYKGGHSTGWDGIFAGGKSGSNELDEKSSTDPFIPPAIILDSHLAVLPLVSTSAVSRDDLDDGHPYKL